jgi:P27 family predicted phage terminase small subunit
MAIEGRKPKPTALKRLEGNPGLRPLNEREPRPRLSLSRCPPHVQGVARREWHRIGRILLRLGLLTEADKTALEIYCLTYQHWVEAEQMIAKTHLVIKGNKQPLILNPFFIASQRLAAQLQAIMVEFGLTPSSRSRLSVPEKRATELDDVLAQAEAVVSEHESESE